MFKSASRMKNLAIHALDGQTGSIAGFFFDDEQWTIRYLLVNIGSRLSPNHVLISSVFMKYADWDAKQLHVSLTNAQIKKSPSTDTRKPVSRQQEADYVKTFGTSHYWGGPYVWGMGPYPMMPTGIPANLPKLSEQELSDVHLRSINAVAGYHIQAIDGQVGHVEDFIVDQQDWSIHYLAVVTKDWWPGKKVLLAPDWVTTLSWTDSRIAVGVTREAIKTAPEYLESRQITREYETQLHQHYGRLPYWMWTSRSAQPQGAPASAG
jgi:hypothetical protein